MCNRISSLVMLSRQLISIVLFLVICRLLFISTTGWPKSKFAISNSYNSINMHFWPHVGKAKICFGCLHLFHKIVNKKLEIVNSWKIEINVGLQNTSWGQIPSSVFSELCPIELANLDHPVASQCGKIRN